MVSSKDAERVRDLFALQLAFAGRMAELTGLTLPQAVSRYSNLHRRFGLGDIDVVPPSPDWARYLDGLERAASDEARLAWTLEAYARSPDEPPTPGRTAVGCFAFDPPDAEGVVRIHFYNRDVEGGAGPLARGKTAERTRELAAMFALVRRTHPAATSVAGRSWLYNLEAYRRLFPPAYAASRAPPAGPVRLSGASSWGQFVDHRGAIKPELRDRLLAKLDDLDPTAPWRAFPLPALAVSASIAAFYRFYGV
jgi:hypothetical protein